MSASKMFRSVAGAMAGILLGGCAAPVGQWGGGNIYTGDAYARGSLVRIDIWDRRGYSHGERPFLNRDLRPEHKHPGRLEWRPIHR